MDKGKYWLGPAVVAPGKGFTVMLRDKDGFARWFVVVMIPLGVLVAGVLACLLSGVLMVGGS